MEKILLAIDGSAPDSRVFSFAISLCKRMRTGLDVLQITGLRRCKKNLKKVAQGARQARNVFENAMVAATFAEAGQHDLARQLKMQDSENLERLIPQSEKDVIDYHLTLKSGKADEEIVRYVSDHRDVVLTIYAASGSADQQAGESVIKKTVVRRIGQKLSIPLVVMREM